MPNKTSKYVWQYQAAVGTSILTIATSASFEFGEFNKECGKWSSPYPEFKAEASWVYGALTPTLTDLAAKYPTFSIPFLPVTIQFLAWFLGLPTDTNPTETDTVTVVALTSGITYPLTIRNQQDGGTAPQNSQAVDCYCVGLLIKGEDEKKLLVEPKFAWGAFEDIGDNVNITTPPLAAGGLTGPYNGHPDVTWNVTSMTGVWRADVMLNKEFDIVDSDEGVVQTVYPGKILPVQIILSAVLKQNTSWDDYKARTARTLTITWKKFDGTSYITLTFTNAKVISVKKTGHRNAGHYGAIMALEAEKVEGLSDFFTEGGSGFGTHFKAAL